MLSSSEDLGQQSAGPSVFGALLTGLARDAVTAFVTHCAERGADEEQLVLITQWANEFINEAFPEEG